MKAAGYVRVSTREQATGGHSIDAQKRAIRAYCDLKGWDLVKVYADAGESGATLKRPALASLLAAVETHAVEACVVTALDRLSRRTRDLLELRDSALGKNGCALVMLREGVDCTTPTGKMVFTMMAAAGELELELLREKTRDGIAEAKKAGHYPGRVPFGFRQVMRSKQVGRVKKVVRARFVAVPKDRAALAKAKRLRRQGLSLRVIAEKMDWTLKATRCRLGTR